MSWHQRQLTLRPRRSGYHLITDEIVEAFPEISTVRVGLLHIFMLHTSASLIINVKRNMEASLNSNSPEDFPDIHTAEGTDDMPAHVKASLMGASVTVPIKDGRLVLGTWQGIYLCEHRNRAAGRRLALTLHGE